MYPSDYGYASSECYQNKAFHQTDENDYRQETCTSTNWLYNGGYQWTLSPISGNRNGVRVVVDTGYVGSNVAGNRVGIRPTLYLSSSVKITGGNGTSSNSYMLSK